MDVDDGSAVPTDDPLAQSTRRALGAIAGGPDPSWEAVVAGVRRVRRIRFAVAGAIVAAIVLALAASVQAAGGHPRSVRVESPEATTSTSSPENASTTTLPPTTTTTPAHRSNTTVWNPLVVSGTTTSVPPGSTTTTTVFEPLHPNATNLAATLDSVDDTSMTVGQTTKLRGTITNIAGQPVTTQDYFATIAGCGLPGAIIVNEGYLATQVLQPGETISYAVDFTPGPEDVGTDYCTIGFSSQLPEIAAPSGPGPNVIAVTVNPATGTT